MKYKMEKLEKQILIKGRKILKDSITTDWKSAGFDEWSDWAKKIKHSIECFLEITSPLLMDESNEVNNLNK